MNAGPKQKESKYDEIKIKKICDGRKKLYDQIDSKCYYLTQAKR